MTRRLPPMLPAAALFLAAGLLFRPATLEGATRPPARPQPARMADSLVRVNSTNQAYDFLRPWSKKPPFTRRGIGVVVGENRVLVTAELVASHNFIEFERPESGERAVAKMVFVDYDTNLALLEGEDPEFLRGAPAVRLAASGKIGEEAVIVQIEPNGTAAETTARLSTITTGPYLAEDIPLLIFRLTAPIQQREGSFVLPAFHGSELLGLLMRYDSRNQTADVIPAPVISRFLEEAEEGRLSAFPRAGITYSALRDPQLRDYLGLEKNGGVFLGRIDPGSSAEKAGLRQGDVLLRIGEHAIDADGNFEHPEFGRLPMGYLVSTAGRVGDVVPFEIFREGRRVEIPVTLERRDRETMSVPPYLFDRQPRFLIVGGMVFRELNRSYLVEWGPDWRASAPQRLVHADLFQQEISQPGRKVVFLSHVVPTPATLGYEVLSDMVVRAVDGKPVSSLEELRDALEDGAKGIHRIDLEDDPRVVFLDPTTAEETAEILKREYGIRQLDNLENSAPRQ